MMTKRLALFISTTFYSGFFPIAPGTVGAFIAIIALWFLPAISWPLLVGLTCLVYFIGVWAANIAEDTWGKDPGRVNWDEVAGMMVTVIAAPKHWIIYVAAFLLFRVFDVIKPWPVNKMEELPGGWGIMTDDIFAGIYAAIVLQLTFRVFIHL